MSFEPKDRYQLRFQFKSNERPWSGSHTGYKIDTDEQAIEWARYFADKIGDDYNITLFKNDKLLPFELAQDEQPIDEGARDLFSGVS